jgi:hypothetical protein
MPDDVAMIAIPRHKTHRARSPGPGAASPILRNGECVPAATVAAVRRVNVLVIDGIGANSVSHALA